MYSAMFRLVLLFSPFFVASLAIQPEVIFEGPDTVKLRLKGDHSILKVKFEVVPFGQPSRTQLVENSNNGVWEFHDPDLKVSSGDLLRYKLTVFYEYGIKETEWMAQELDPFRNVRSMRRAHNVVFRDEYTSCNIPQLKSQYKVDCTAWGGGNNEFEMYVPEERNLFCKNGNLLLKPTLTVDHPDFDENRIHHGNFDLKSMYGYCTMSENWGCARTAVNNNVLNPIMSGKLTTKASIRYGKVNVRAMIPKGDWIWPAIWMLPRDWKYGGWPRSGEIDIMESRGNARAEAGGVDMGIKEVSSTLHWGPASNQNAYGKTHGAVHTGGSDGWHGWHLYTLEWDENHISTYVDNQRIMYIPTPSGSFWQYGGFGGGNIWSSGGKNAPFDQEFQLILNVAVGGGFFPSSFNYDHRRPWNDNSARREGEFWDDRGTWLATWHGDNAAMQIDYVEMIQL